MAKKSEVILNKWQQHYVDTRYGGKMPRDKVGKYELELLGSVKSNVRVHIPEHDGSPEKVEDFKVTLDECNMPEGIISVEVLSSNLRFWMFRGWSVQTY